METLLTSSKYRIKFLLKKCKNSPNLLGCYSCQMNCHYGRPSFRPSSTGQNNQDCRFFSATRKQNKQKNGDEDTSSVSKPNEKKKNERKEPGANNNWRPVLSLPNLNMATLEHCGTYVKFDDATMALVPEGLAGDVDTDIAWAGGKPVDSLIIREDYMTIASRMEDLENGEYALKEAAESTKLDPSKAAKPTLTKADGANEPTLGEAEEVVQKGTSKYEDSTSKKAVVLCGPRGVGKSMILNLALLRARQNNWLTMYIKDCREWVTPKGAHIRGTKTGVGIVESKIRHEMFGQPLGAQETLNNLVQVHGDKLQKLPKRCTYRHNAYSMSDDDSLMSIANRGLKSKIFASDAVYDLRMEFGLVTEYPVLLAIDQINAFYWPTCFFANSKCVAPSSLLCAEAFRPFDLNGRIRPGHELKRGLILAGSTGKYGWPVKPETIVENVNDTGMYFFRPFDVRHGGIEQRPKWLPEHKWEPRDIDIDQLNVKQFNAEEAHSYIFQMKRKDMLDDTSSVLKRDQFNTLMATSGGIAHILRENVLNPFF